MENDTTAAKDVDEVEVAKLQTDIVKQKDSTQGADGDPTSSSSLSDILNNESTGAKEILTKAESVLVGSDCNTSPTESFNHNVEETGVKYVGSESSITLRSSPGPQSDNEPTLPDIIDNETTVAKEIQDEMEAELSRSDTNTSSDEYFKDNEEETIVKRVSSEPRFTPQSAPGSHTDNELQSQNEVPEEWPGSCRTYEEIDPGPDWDVTILLLKISQRLEDKDLREIKFVVSGIDRIPKKDMDKYDSALDLFKFLKQTRMVSNDNILLLQAVLLHIQREDLHKEVCDWAKKRGESLYFYKPNENERVNGFRYIQFHVTGRSSLRRSELETLRERVAKLLSTEPEFVCVTGVEESKSLVVTFLIPDRSANLLKDIFLESSEAFEPIGVDGVRFDIFSPLDLKTGSKPSSFTVSGSKQDTMGVSETGKQNLIKTLAIDCASDNIRNLRGESPLHMIRGDSDEDAKSLKRLHAAGADVDARDSKGNTPLMIILKEGNNSIAQALINLGASVNSRNSRSETPLHMIRGDSKEDAKTLTLLLTAGANVDALDRGRNTPLVNALIRGNNNIAQELVNYCAAVNIRNSRGESPLHMIRGDSDEDAKSLKRLHAAGADLDLRDSGGNTPLMIILKKGNNSIAQALINLGASVNSRNSCSETPLHMIRGDSDEDARSLKLLHSAGADVDARDSEGNTPLMIILKIGNNSIAQALINLGASVNSRNSRSESPLHMIRGDSKEDAKNLTLLLTAGANVDALDWRGDTPLVNALIRGNNNIAQELVNYGASVNIRNSSDESPLHMIRGDSKEDVKNLTLLLTAGANVDAMDCNGNTPLVNALIRGNNNIAQELVNYCAAVNIRNSRGESPLHMIRGDSDEDARSLKLLHSAGADVDARDSEGNTPLMIILKIGNNSIAQALINLGASVNSRNSRSESPLHMIRGDSKEDAKNLTLLLTAGANVDALDWRGDTPLVNALIRGNNNIAQELVNYGASVNIRNSSDESPLHMIRGDSKEDVKNLTLLLTAGANVDALDCNGNTRLLVALRGRNNNIVQELVNHGASVNIRNSSDESPLHMIRGDSKEDVKNLTLLLTAGANVDALDCNGNTPLLVALRGRNNNIVQELVNHGASVNIRNSSGETPLHMIRGDSKEDVKNLTLLLTAGANVDALDCNGNTPLLIALRRQKNNIAQYLVNHGASLNILNSRGETPLHMIRGDSDKDSKSLKLLPTAGADVEMMDYKNYTQPMIALKERDNSPIQSLLNLGASIKSRRAYGETPLHMIRGDSDKDSKSLKLLPTAGANVEMMDYKNYTQPMIALKERDNSPIQSLLNLGASIKSRRAYGETTIHMIRGDSKEDVNNLTLLLTAGANVDALDWRGDTPLLIALRRRNNNIVQVLVNHGASVNIRNFFGESPLHMIRGDSKEDVNSLKLLLTAGADVDAMDSNGNTPLMVALKERNNNIAQGLVNYGASVNILNSRGESPLHMIREDYDRDSNSLKLLLTAGTDVHAMDSTGNTPLMVALKKRNNSIAQGLVNHGASVNIRNSRGESPLHMIRGDSDRDSNSLKLLLTAGADVHAMDSTGNTPLMVALKERNNTIAQGLVNHGASVNIRNSRGESPLHMIRGDSDKDSNSLKLLLTAGADVDAMDPTGNTPLMVALKERNNSIAQSLINQGASVNFPNYSGEFPLMIALKEWNTSIAQGLVNLCVSVNIRNLRGASSLHKEFLTSERLCADTVKCLLEHGANVNAREKSGETPLMISMERRNMKAIQLLVQHGASVEIKDKMCRTALKFAFELNLPHAARYFLANRFLSQSDANDLLKELNEELIASRFHSIGSIHEIQRLQRMEKIMRIGSIDVEMLVHFIPNKPFSLMTLSFIAVSSALQEEHKHKTLVDHGSGFEHDLREELHRTRQNEDFIASSSNLSDDPGPNPNPHPNPPPNPNHNSSEGYGGDNLNSSEDYLSDEKLIISSSKTPSMPISSILHQRSMQDVSNTRSDNTSSRHFSNPSESVPQNSRVEAPPKVTRGWPLTRHGLSRFQQRDIQNTSKTLSDFTIGAGYTDDSTESVCSHNKKERASEKTSESPPTKDPLVKEGKAQYHKNSSKDLTRREKVELLPLSTELKEALLFHTETAFTDPEDWSELSLDNIF